MISIIKARNFPADFCNRTFLGGSSLYAVTSLIVALSLSLSDITTFRPWSTSAKEFIWFGPEKNPKFAQRYDTFDVF